MRDAPSVTISCPSHKTNDFTSSRQLTFTVTGSVALTSHEADITADGCDSPSIQCVGLECTVVCEDVLSTIVTIEFAAGVLTDVFDRTNEAAVFVMNIGEGFHFFVLSCLALSFTLSFLL